jgi:hypothetical protein
VKVRLLRESILQSSALQEVVNLVCSLVCSRYYYMMVYLCLKRSCEQNVHVRPVASS